MVRRLLWAVPWALMIAACQGDAAPERAVTGHRPAGRIVTLAPHLAELVFIAGAGDRLVGVAEYSDFPSEALDLPRIGDAFRLDYETMAGLDPDLILAWGSGTPREVVERLKGLGYRVIMLDSGNLDAVADNLREIGRLAGTERPAEAAATAYERALGDMRATAAGRRPVTVFYQVSAQPLFTITRRHVIGEAIELCGGHNVFGDLAELSPSISPEAVIEAGPEAIIAGRSAQEAAQDSLAVWRQWPSIPAVRNGSLFFVDADLMHRSSVRILDGVRALCDRIAEAREKSVPDTNFKSASPTSAHPGRHGGSARER